jgi:hypothetical protein
MSQTATKLEKILFTDKDIALIKDTGLYHEIESIVNRAVEPAESSPPNRVWFESVETYPGERYKFYAAEREAKKIKETRDQIAKAQALKVGDGITKHLYTDAHAFTIVEIKADKRGNILIAKQDKATMTNRKDLEFIPGGFVGHYPNQRDQEWAYEPNPNGEIRKVRIKADGSLVGVGHGDDWSIGRHEFYDLNF